MGLLSIFLLWGCSHIDSNIPNSILYSTFVGETLSIALSTLHFFDVFPKSRGLVSVIIQQVGKVRQYHSSLKKIINKYQKYLSKFDNGASYLKRHVLVLITSHLFIAISINRFLFPSIVGRWDLKLLVFGNRYTHLKTLVSITIYSAN